MSADVTQLELSQTALGEVLEIQRDLRRDDPDLEDRAREAQGALATLFAGPRTPGDMLRALPAVHLVREVLGGAQHGGVDAEALVQEIVAAQPKGWRVAFLDHWAPTGNLVKALTAAAKLQASGLGQPSEVSPASQPFLPGPLTTAPPLARRQTHGPRSVFSGR